MFYRFHLCSSDHHLPLVHFPLLQGRNHGWKVEGDQGLGPNTGALAPRNPCAPKRLCPAPGLWWVREGFAPSRCGVRGFHGSGGVTRGKCLKSQMLNPAFWWLLRSLVGSRGRVYQSKQQACQELNQFKNCRNQTHCLSLSTIAGWISTKMCGVRSNWYGMTESHWEVTILAVKFLAFWKLRPKSWGQYIVGPQT